MQTKSTIVLIGDSTLDNIVWVNGYQNCTKAKIEKLLPNFNVVNLAADGFTSSDVIGGGQPTISWKARSMVDPFPVANGQRLSPLNQLKKLARVDFVVLSIGGNDIRGLLHDMSHVQTNSQNLIVNYHHIVSEILKICPKLILMMQYRPSLANDFYIYEAMKMLPPHELAPEKKLNRIMEAIYDKIIKIAQQNRLAMLDLPNSFDIMNHQLYVSQIEPSSKGGDIIAGLISQAINHNFEKLQFYRNYGGITTYELKEGEKWHVFI